MTDRTLVVAGHGSHRNPDSSAPAYAHAAAARERTGVPVREAFWKEEPSFREALRTVDTEEAVVVPLFVSEGYFTEEVLPREFRLGEGDRAARDDPISVGYADPVGTHPEMRTVVLERVRRLYGDPDGEVGLALVGHGTDRNPNSARAVVDHAAALSERDELGEVRIAFMDEEPYVENVVGRFDADDVVVVPLFIADGFHTRDEIPELLGIEDESGDYPVPARADGRRVWYSSAVGTDPALVDVVLERAAEAGLAFDESEPSSRTTDSPVRADDGASFLEWVEDAPLGPRGLPEREWGELVVADGDDDGYELRHRDDRDAPADELESATLADQRELFRYDERGRYRPFAGERSLPTGWTLDGLDADDLLTAVATAYPVAVENWALERSGDLDAVSFDAVADRQTGIYDCVSELSREQLERTVEACCGDCAKRRAWDANDGGGASRSQDAGDAAVPCREPCSFLVAAAREFLRYEDDTAAETFDDESHDDRTDVPRGDLTAPANRYRVRYREAGRTSRSTTER